MIYDLSSTLDYICKNKAQFKALIGTNLFLLQAYPCFKTMEKYFIHTVILNFIFALNFENDTQNLTSLYALCTFIICGKIYLSSDTESINF